MPYVNVRFHLYNDTVRMPVYSPPLTFGSDPRCSVRATDPDAARLAGVLMHTEYGIIVFCVDDAYPIIITPERFGEPHQAIPPGFTRLVQYSFGFEIAGVVGDVHCSVEKQNSFRNATGNSMRQLVTVGQRLDIVFFNAVCFPILFKNPFGDVRVMLPLPAHDTEEEEIDR